MAPGADSKTVKKRLLAKGPGGVDGLVRLMLDDLAAKPVRELVDVQATAGVIGDWLRSAAEDECLVDRLRQRIDRAVTGGDELGLAESPPDIIEPIRDVLKAPWTADPKLMRELLDHRAVRNVTRDILTDSLLRFGRQLRSLVPGSGRPRSRLGKLAGMATGVASVAAGVLASEVERQLEGRVRDVIDDAISRAMDRSVSFLSGRDAAADLAAWRVHAFDTVRKRTVAEVQADVERLDREGLIRAVADAIVQVAQWEGLDQHLHDRVRAGLDLLGDQPIGELFDAEAPGWRERVAGPVADRIRGLVRTRKFGAWLKALTEP